MFREGRGLALSLTLSGTAVAQAVVPPIANALIGDFGWRGAYVGLGLGGGLIAFLACLFFLFDGYDKARAQRASGGDTKGPLPDAPGLSIGEAWRDWSLWRIALSTFVMMVITIALNVHQFEILRSAGVDRSSAALYSSITGVAGVAGKLITGWFLDRHHVRWVGGLTLGLRLSPSRS